MADEQKTYLINFESNIEEYTQKAVKARERVDELTIANIKLKGSGEATADELERSASELRVAEQEYRNLKKSIDLANQANRSQKDSYNALYKQWQLAQTQLKNMAGAYTTNADGVLVLSEEYMKQSQIVATAKKALDEFGKGVNDNRLNVGNYEGAVVSLRQELKNITVELALMKMRGEENSQAYRDLAARGGQLTDTLTDVRAELKLVGSDTSGIDMAVGSFMALGSAVQVAEGTMQLFGSENEDVQRGIQKMVAIQSVLNGVQQVANSLQKESALMMGLNAVKTKAVAAAQAIYTAAVGTSTGALKIFRTALLSTGIGAIVVAIGLLISNWDKLAAMFGKSAREAKAINDEMARMKTLSEAQARQDEFRLHVMKELGDVESDLTQKEIENNRNRQREAFAMLGMYQKLYDTGKLTADQQKEWTEKNIEYEKLRQEATILGIRWINQQKEEVKKAEEEMIKAKEKAAERRKQLADEEKKRIQEQIDLQLAEAKGDPEKMKAALKYQFDEMVKQQGLSDAARKLLKLQYEQAITDIEREQLQKRLDQQAEFDQAGIEQKQRDEQIVFEMMRNRAGENVTLLQEELDAEMAAFRSSTEYQKMGWAERAAAEEQYTDAVKALSDLRRRQRDKELDAAASAFGDLSQAAGEATVAGKGFAVAETLINTWKAAQAAYAGFQELPQPYGTIAGAIAAGAAIASGLANVKRILAVDPKGKSASASGGGSSSNSMSLTAASQHITAQKAGSTTLTPNTTTQAIQTAQAENSLTAQDVADAVSKVTVKASVEDINAKIDQTNKVTIAANI